MLLIESRFAVHRMLMIYGRVLFADSRPLAANKLLLIQDRLLLANVADSGLLGVKKVLLIQGRCC